MFQNLSKKNCSPELLAGIADIIDSPIFITKRGDYGIFDHRIIYVNRAFCELTGHDEQQLVGRSPDILCDMKQSEDLMAGFYSSSAAGSQFKTKLTSYNKDGGSFELELKVNPVKEEGGVEHCLVLCEKVETQVVDNGQQTTDNPALREELLAEIGRNIEASTAVHDLDEVTVEDPQAQPPIPNSQSPDLSYDAILNEIEAELGRPEQELKPKPVLVQPVEAALPENPKAEIMQNMVDKITTKSEQEAALEIKKQEAENISNQIAPTEGIDADFEDAAKSRFLSSMSHDLRTPLNAIIGFSEVIRDQLFGPIDNPRYVSYASDIYRSGQELLATIAELLELSEIEGDGGEAEIDEVEDFVLSDLIEEVIELLSSRAFQADVKILKRLEAQDIVMNGDRRKIKQALASVIGNAIKCSPSGGKLEVTSEITAEGEFKFVLYLKSANLIATGSSLGALLGTVTNKVESEYPEISLARKFVEAHEGQFTIFNSATSGTEITILLPSDKIGHSSESKSHLQIIN